MRKTINVGLIGYKFMGKAHSNAFARLPMFFDPGAIVCMKAICGRDAAGVEEARIKFGWESAETDYNKLVSRKDIDLVDVTAPSNFHKPIVLAAIQNGKHVFCEKPLALNLADAREMLEAAQKSGVQHQIGFNYRFLPAVQFAKKLIDAGKLGTIYHFRGLYLQDWIIDPMFPMVWRLNKDIAGSGSLGDLGAHVIDLAHFLVGSVKTVTGMNKTFIKKRPVVENMTGLSAKAREGAPMVDINVDDVTSFSCEFDCGAMGTFEATRFAQGNKNALTFEVNGSKGSIKFNMERMNELQFFDATAPEGQQGFALIQTTEGVHPYAANWWPAGHIIGYEHSFVHEMYEFVRAISEGGTAAPGFEAGVAVAQVLDAVDLSIARKAWVDVASL
jgi:predicted dehydrogenase